MTFDTHERNLAIRNRVIELVRAERVRQLTLWSIDHDDEHHGPVEWSVLMLRDLRRAEDAAYAGNRDEWVKRTLYVAALAVAALEAEQRGALEGLQWATTTTE